MTLSPKLALAALLYSGVAAAAPQISLSRPVEQRPGCLADEVRIPRGLVAFLPDQTTLDFTVTHDGKIEGVTSDARAGREALDTQFRGALSRCTWTPATDLAGVPVTRRVSVPIRFESPQGGPLVASVGAFTPVALASR
ncbi:MULTISPECIES: energy transducer TonB [Anaeromyxobacter]|uniref:energy transducer TonB n=1 Tax=Anaeromyxobacter TaxID=161492 RepID=UPI001F5A29DE|nr:MULTISPECIES: energy transducer TonB [unclassified Anaeromyxobacter]